MPSADRYKRDNKDSMGKSSGSALGRGKSVKGFRKVTGGEKIRASGGLKRPDAKKNKTQGGRDKNLWEQKHGENKPQDHVKINLLGYVIPGANGDKLADAIKKCAPYLKRGLDIYKAALVVYKDPEMADFVATYTRIYLLISEVPEGKKPLKKEEGSGESGGEEAKPPGEKKEKPAGTPEEGAGARGGHVDAKTGRVTSNQVFEGPLGGRVYRDRNGKIQWAGGGEHHQQPHLQDLTDREILGKGELGAASRHESMMKKSSGMMRSGWAHASLGHIQDLAFDVRIASGTSEALQRLHNNLNQHIEEIIAETAFHELDPMARHAYLAGFIMRRINRGSPLRSIVNKGLVEHMKRVLAATIFTDTPDKTKYYNTDAQAVEALVAITTPTDPIFLDAMAQAGKHNAEIPEYWVQMQKELNTLTESIATKYAFGSQGLHADKVNAPSDAFLEEVNKVYKKYSLQDTPHITVTGMEAQYMGMNAIHEHKMFISESVVKDAQKHGGNLEALITETLFHETIHNSIRSYFKSPAEMYQKLKPFLDKNATPINLINYPRRYLGTYPGEYGSKVSIVRGFEEELAATVGIIAAIAVDKDIERVFHADGRMDRETAKELPFYKPALEIYNQMMSKTPVKGKGIVYPKPKPNPEAAAEGKLNISEIRRFRDTFESFHERFTRSTKESMPDALKGITSDKTTSFHRFLMDVGYNDKGVVAIMDKMSESVRERSKPRDEILEDSFAEFSKYMTDNPETKAWLNFRSLESTVSESPVKEKKIPPKVEERFDPQLQREPTDTDKFDMQEAKESDFKSMNDADLREYLSKVRTMEKPNFELLHAVEREWAERHHPGEEGTQPATDWSQVERPYSDYSDTELREAKKFFTEKMGETGGEEGAEDFNKILDELEKRDVTSNVLKYKKDERIEWLSKLSDKQLDAYNSWYYELYDPEGTNAYLPDSDQIKQHFYEIQSEMNRRAFSPNRDYVSDETDKAAKEGNFDEDAFNEPEPKDDDDDIPSEAANKPKNASNPKKRFRKEGDGVGVKEALLEDGETYVDESVASTLDVVNRLGKTNGHSFETLASDSGVQADHIGHKVGSDIGYIAIKAESQADRDLLRAAAKKVGLTTDNPNEDLDPNSIFDTHREQTAYFQQGITVRFPTTVKGHNGDDLKDEANKYANEKVGSYKKDRSKFMEWITVRDKKLDEIYESHGGEHKFTDDEVKQRWAAFEQALTDLVAPKKDQLTEHGYDPDKNLNVAVWGNNGLEVAAYDEDEEFKKLKEQYMDDGETEDEAQKSAEAMYEDPRHWDAFGDESERGPRLRINEDTVALSFDAGEDDFVYTDLADGEKGAEKKFLDYVTNWAEFITAVRKGKFGDRKFIKYGDRRTSGVSAEEFANNQQRLLDKLMKDAEKHLQKEDP